MTEYKKLSETDALTKLANRRAFDRAMEGSTPTTARPCSAALILADIDRFKPVNDKHGHPIGDRILQIVASIFKASMSTNVTVARTGGEEFGMIVNGMSEKAVADLAEEIRSAVEQTPFVNRSTGADYGPITGLVRHLHGIRGQGPGPSSTARRIARSMRQRMAAATACTSHSALKDGKLTKGVEALQFRVIRPAPLPAVRSEPAAPEPRSSSPPPCRCRR